MSEWWGKVQWRNRAVPPCSKNETALCHAKGGVGALLAGDEDGDPLGTSPLATSVTSQTQKDVSLFAAKEEIQNVHCFASLESAHRIGRVICLFLQGLSQETP